MARAKANGIEIEYETAGNKADPALLLIMGLGAQLTIWPDALVEGLAKKGFFVIRYDNRDTGLTTDFGSWGVPNIAEAIGKVMTGKKVDAPYLVKDMAGDGDRPARRARHRQGAHGRRVDGRHDRPDRRRAVACSARARWCRSIRPAAGPACRRASPRRWRC